MTTVLNSLAILSNTDTTIWSFIFVYPYPTLPVLGPDNITLNWFNNIIIHSSTSSYLNLPFN